MAAALMTAMVTEHTLPELLLVRTTALQTTQQLFLFEFLTVREVVLALALLLESTG